MSAEVFSSNTVGTNPRRNYGHAAVIAYTTYKNPVFLEYAKQVWWAMNTYTILQKELDVGTTPLKNFTLEPTCEGGK